MGYENWRLSLSNLMLPWMSFSLGLIWINGSHSTIDFNSFDKNSSEAVVSAEDKSGKIAILAVAINCDSKAIPPVTLAAVVRWQ